jgi:hypothetical protein
VGWFTVKLGVVAIGTKLGSLNHLKVSEGYFNGESFVPVPGLSILKTNEPPVQ